MLGLTEYMVLDHVVSKEFQVQTAGCSVMSLIFSVSTLESVPAFVVLSWLVIILRSAIVS